MIYINKMSIFEHIDKSKFLFSNIVEKIVFSLKFIELVRICNEIRIFFQAIF